ncbi:MAG: ATP-binding cassette domain-containing protein [Tissierellia bacterium]|nr:ATP-binding cassette domain-containing protein [Tissierellia bacterium]
MSDKKILFKIENLKKFFPIKKAFFTDRQRYVHANENISLNIYQGETLGLVGESGSGKSTFGRTIIQLHEQTEGTTLYYGKTVSEIAPKYVGNLVNGIPKLYPEYKKAVVELDELYAQRREATEEEKIHELEDKLMFKRRDIQNKYLNMVRLAGGLLVLNNLSEVSNVLKAQNEARAKVAEINEKIEIIDKKLKDSEYESKASSLTAEKENLMSQRSTAIDERDSKDRAVEVLREQARLIDGFEDLEKMRDDGIDLSQLTVSEMRKLRKDLQIIFQDPYSSLDTKLTVGNIIGEGVVAHNMFKSRKSKGYNEYIQKVMAQCGLAPYFIHRYPHQFSGGQRQRIGIARALAVEPNFIVCDEAVSALDVSIQSQVINLLQDLKENNNLTYLFITHDLSVVKYISDRIAVMYLGNVVELADSEAIFAGPLHPYTEALLNAIPRTDVDSDQVLSILEGDVPSAVNPPDGCRFHTRCKYVMDRCLHFEPELQDMGNGHFVACHLMDMDLEERERYMAERNAEELAKQIKEDVIFHEIIEENY